jgi:hypothetical protein
MGTGSGLGAPVAKAIISACKIGYMSGFVEKKHQTEIYHLLAKRKIETYFYIRHVGRMLVIPLRRGLLILIMTGFEGRLKFRLQFQKQ